MTGQSPPPAQAQAGSALGRGRHRERIVAAAVALFRRRGYAATGLAEIVAESGAPRGSLYHYFPDGKVAIGAAAVEEAGRRVAATLAALLAEQPTAADALRAYGALLAGWMADSGWRDGCPITATLLETAPDLDPPTQAGAVALGGWVDAIAAALVRDGVAPARAGRLARLAVAAIQGSLVQARVARSAEPIHDAMDEVARACVAAVEV